MEPLFQEFTKDYPYTNLLVRGDSGYATPDLYEQCEEYGAQYVIRLKANACLYRLAEPLDRQLYDKTKVIKRLEKIVEQAKKMMQEIAIVDYAKVA